MSLVNKMLSDLEKRHAYLDENQDMVLDGLYSAYDVELKEQTRKASGIFKLLLLIVMSVFTTIMYLVQKEPTFQINVISDKQMLDIISEDKIDIKEKASIIETTKEQFHKREEYFLRLDSRITSLNESEPGIKLDEESSINKIEKILFETNDSGINLVLKTKEDIDYLVYRLDNPDRVVVEVNNAKLGFRLEDLNPIAPINAIRYSVNDENRFKLVLETDQPLHIRKSISGENEEHYDLVVEMGYIYEDVNRITKQTDELEKAVDTQVEEEKSISFKGDLIKTPVIQTKSSYADKLFRQAYEEYRVGNITVSLKQLNSILDIDASHTKSRGTLALILAEKGHKELAYSVLNEGLIQYPDNVEWVKIYARLLLDENKYIEAKEVLARVKPELATQTEYYALLAVVSQKLNEHQVSARVYRDMLQVNPLKSEWWIGLGISLESLKRYQDALYAYQKAFSNPSLARESRGFLSQRINRLNNLIQDESS